MSSLWSWLRSSGLTVLASQFPWPEVWFRGSVFTILASQCQLHGSTAAVMASQFPRPRFWSFVLDQIQFPNGEMVENVPGGSGTYDLFPSLHSNMHSHYWSSLSELDVPRDVSQSRQRTALTCWRQREGELDRFKHVYSNSRIPNSI